MFKNKREKAFPSTVISENYRKMCFIGGIC